MADEVSEAIFDPLSAPESGRSPSFLSFGLFFIALLMSFFIAKQNRFNPLWALKQLITITPNKTTPQKEEALIHRSLNRLVDPQYITHPALLGLCKITNIDLSYNASLENIIQKTQKYWLRQSGTERYEIPQGVYDTHKSQILPLLKALNVVNAVKAKYTQTPYDVVLVHGATADAVMTRIQFLIAEYQRGVRFKKVVLLSGDRPLETQLEAEYIKLGLKTEAEMFQYLWNKTSGLPNALKQNAYLINAKGKIVKGRYKRPNTRDTIHQWLDEIPPQSGTRCLAVSHQPFVTFQDFVLYNTLKERFGHLYLETIGQNANHEEPVLVHLDNLARCLYEIQFSKRFTSYHSL